MIIKRFKKLHYKELFVYGSYLSLIILGGIATIVDFIRDSHDTIYDFLFTILAFLILQYGLYKKHIDKLSVILFWLATIFEFIFLYINRVDFDLIYAILLPLLAFVSMSLRVALINLVIFYILFIAFLIYHYYECPYNIFLHNFKYMFSYFLAHGFMIAYGFFYHLAIDESIKRLEKANQRNLLLLKEVHHRVKNNLNLMASILGLQLESSDNKVAKEALKGSKSRIEAMAVLHEVLYKGDNQNAQSLKTYIDRLVETIIASESVHDKIEIFTKIDPIKLSMNSLIELGILLNEMITNSIKHALNDGVVRIDITFIKGKNECQLIYCDTAKDVDLDKLKKGFGFNLITLVVYQFNGRMEIDNSNGLCYKISFDHLEEL